MIVGQVDANRQPMIPLAIRDSSGNRHDFTAMIDTGFSGFIALAPDVIARLSLPYNDTQDFILGDGSIVRMSLYDAVVMWDGQERTVQVLEADGDPLIGMAMLEGFTLFLDATPGGVIRIEPRP